MGTPFPVTMNRFDPYKNYRFRVYFHKIVTSGPALPTATGQSLPVAGVSKVTGLRRSTPAVEHPEGGNPVILKGIGRTKYEPITLERGVTHDTEFEDWANAVQILDKGIPKSTPTDFRKTLEIELCNEAGVGVLWYIVHNCWVSEYQAWADLDAGANAIALEHIRVENEGWERDRSRGEPAEKIQ